MDTRSQMNGGEALSLLEEALSEKEKDSFLFSELSLFGLLSLKGKQTQEAVT